MNEMLLVRGMPLSATGDFDPLWVIDAELDLEGSLSPDRVPSIQDIKEVISSAPSRTGAAILAVVADTVLDALMASFPQVVRCTITLWELDSENSTNQAGFRTTRERPSSSSRQGRSIRRPQPR
ncbi:MAG: hypothetical protein AB7G88_08900 [Thermomicrobiales bacterium]